MSRANKTQTALDTLTTQLKETGILVDNITNTSLALANTQFIESRVQEDDIEIKENSEKQEVSICKMYSMIMIYNTTLWERDTNICKKSIFNISK